MTQIIATITQDYAMLASDRRLTFVSGPHEGKIAEDDKCKLVNLCNIAGIGYTGLAIIEGMSTHEWIGKRLAEKACQDPRIAAIVLGNEAGRAFANISMAIEQSFLLAGWGLLRDHKTLRSHFRLITNAHDANGKRLAVPSPEFRLFERSLKDGEDLDVYVIGHPLSEARGKMLKRYLRRLVVHEIGPKQAMLSLVEEISFTAKTAHTVGGKILCLCIPRIAAHSAIFSNNPSPMLAQEPDLRSASFCYFDPEYSELRQFGPTFTCGEMAVTDVETKNDPGRDYQSAQIRLLHLPEKKKA